MITAMQDSAAPPASKTQRKKEMHDLQALGVALVELPESQLAAMQIAESGQRLSFRRLGAALDADPTYADAIFNLGLLHQRADRPTEAASCWQRYLALDKESPWASRARQALKYCEMRIAHSS